jgi:hypothetical protein
MMEGVTNPILSFLLHAVALYCSIGFIVLPFWIFNLFGMKTRAESYFNAPLQIINFLKHKLLNLFNYGKKQKIGIDRA